MTYYLLLVAVAAQGLSGIGGGLGLVADPTGEALGIPLHWLDGTPFASYLVPGLFLLSVLGVFPLVTALGLWKGRPWAWYAALLVGISLAIWLVVEILMIGYQPEPPLQAAYGLLSLAIVGLTLAPSVRERVLRERGTRRA